MFASCPVLVNAKASSKPSESFANLVFFAYFDGTSDEIKEEILMAYAIKNQYNLYECGPSNETERYLCIDKETLNSKDLLNKFNIKL